MKKMNLKLKIWRQIDKYDSGEFREYDLKGLNPNMSLACDVLRENLNPKCGNAATKLLSNFAKNLIKKSGACIVGVL